METIEPDLSEEREQLEAVSRPPVRKRLWGWFKENYVTVGGTIFLLWVVVIPIGFLIIFSFRGGSPVAPGDFTLEHYQTVYGSSLTYEALLNTLIYAAVTSVAAIVVAGGFAWLLERTDVPARNWAWSMMILPLAMPGMLASMSWILLLGERNGIINVLIRGGLSFFGLDLETGPIDIYSMGGMLFVESIRGSTSLFLLMVGSFRLMDPALEEAAAVAGAKTAYTVRKITAAMLVPALLATSMYAFIGNLDDFETPLLIGLPAGIYVLPTLIYFMAFEQSAWGLAAAYTTIFLLITVTMVIIYHRIVLKRVESFATITGKAFRPRRTQLGRWRWPAFGIFLAYFFVTIVLPFVVLLWASLQPVYTPPSMEALQSLTLENYADVFSRSRILDSLWNSTVLAVATATATMVLAFLVSWAVVRQRVRGRLVLDSLTFIPHSLPAVAVGVALIAFYLHPWLRWLPLYGTMALMVLALMTRYIAFASRTSNGAMAQIERSLEEAAYVSGVGKLRVLLRITAPLLFPAFVAGWIFVAANAFRNLTIPLLMATPENQTIAATLFHYWERQADFSLASALGVLLFLGLGVMTMLARRLIVRGYSGE